MTWETGAGRGSRRAYLGCSPLRAFLLQRALEDARLGGKAKGPCGTSGAGGGYEWEPRSGRSTRNRAEVARPGEATMKPSSEEEEELVQGVGPWDECFEVAVQLALRAGQVSEVAAPSSSELQGTPEMGGVGVLRARGRERSELQGQGLCCFWAHLSLALHPPSLQREEVCMGSMGVSTLGRRAQPSGKHEGRPAHWEMEWPSAGYLTLAFESPGTQTSLRG